MHAHTQKMPSSEKQQPIRPPPPAHVREIGEGVARYNFNADTNVELSLRKVNYLMFVYVNSCMLVYAGPDCCGDFICLEAKNIFI